MNDSGTRQCYTELRNENPTQQDVLTIMTTTMITQTLQVIPQCALK